MSLSILYAAGFFGGEKLTKVAIATGIHLYPYRTEKLSPFAPMVLLYQVGE